MSLLSLCEVSHSFAGAHEPAVHAVSLSVSEGERVVIVGQSGSGKTTVLNIALGFITPQAGEVEIADPASAGLVFQNPLTSLDPRWTVERIVREGSTTQVDRSDVISALHSIDLGEELLGRYVSDISGGQAQRVAIARALLSNPSLLVADEPVSAVDVLGKQHIIEALARIQRERNLATLIVLHDLGVAQQVSDTLVVMHRGRIVEQGSTREILAHPQHEYTKQLIDAARW